MCGVHKGSDQRKPSSIGWAIVIPGMITGFLSLGKSGLQAARFEGLWRQGLGVPVKISIEMEHTTSFTKCSSMLLQNTRSHEGSVGPIVNSHLIQGNIANIVGTSHRAGVTRV